MYNWSSIPKYYDHYLIIIEQTLYLYILMILELISFAKIKVNSWDLLSKKKRERKTERMGERGGFHITEFCSMRLVSVWSFSMCSFAMIQSQDNVKTLTRISEARK